MKAVTKIKSLPWKVKRELQAILLLACVVVTFAMPAFYGGYNALKTEHIESSAAITDIDLLLVGSSAFGEARKIMNSTNPDAQEQFIKNVETLVGSKWQNLGLLLGPKDALSGSTWNVFQNPTTLSYFEVQNYNGTDDKAPGFVEAYEKYQAFGSAVGKLNMEARRSHSSAVSVEESLDSLSSAALKLGNFGTKFLNDYNPAPVILSLYDSSNLTTYSDNKLIKIVQSNQVMKQIICLFGDKVAGTDVSFFVMFNIVIAIMTFALSLLLSLAGNQSIGDGFRKFLVRIVIGTVGIYVIGTVMSVMLDHVTDTVLNSEAAESASFIENNLNVYDWYQTGFSIPTTVNDLKIGKDGDFKFSKKTVEAINRYTYSRLTGKTGSAEDIKKRMENYAKDKNYVVASFVTPTYKANSEGEGEAWATDTYYEMMERFAANEELTDAGVVGPSIAIYSSRYLWMSNLKMEKNRGGTWKLSMLGTTDPTSGDCSKDNLYGLNPISAFNLLRTEFSGLNITATNEVYPTISYVAYDAVNVTEPSDGSNMNSILRFIAIFTIIMAALKGMITIFTAGFGGILAGGIKTAAGSSHGLGQAIGGVIAILGGLIGISLILSVTMTLLDAVYGIAYELLSGAEIIDAILEPIEDAVGDIPLIGDLIMNACECVVGFLLTLIFSLTFPKLGGIPINVFCQYMADLPGKIAERAQMIEGMIMTGRSSAGHGLGPRPGGGSGGGYGRMAAAQASQAFGNAQRQAVGVMAGVGAAGAAITGMGLSAAGKAMNKKADAAEGKPSNPGLDNWDDLSPEEQSAAAAAAADAGDEWDDMDQEARQKAMEERMEAEKADAQEGTDADGADADGESPDGEAESLAGDLDEDADSVNTGDGDMASISEAVGEEGAESAEGADVADDMEGQSLGDEDGNADGADVTDADGLSMAEGGSEEGDADYDNTQETLNAEQNVTNDIKADADARNVDNSSLTEDNDSDDAEGTQLDGKDADGKPISGMNDKDDMAKKAGENTPGSMSANVQNNQTANMKNDQKANIQASQVDKSKATSMSRNETKTGQNTGQKTGTGQSTRSRTSGGEGLNGTSTSAWGKEMTVKEQRKARIMHAVGDGLQMAGGNRTVGDGLKDAAGHLKDAAVAYTISDDVLPTLTGSVREQRRMRDARRRRNQQNNNQ